jgi:hypothetical protein
MAPRKSAAQRAAEAAEAEHATGDPKVLQFNPDRLGAPEPYVNRKYPHAARGNLATQLLAAATVLGYPADVVRSTSDGFRYPEGIDRYLFPSEYRPRR